MTHTMRITNIYADRGDDACRTRWIQVAIHDTVNELRRAAIRTARTRRHASDFADALGTFHPTNASARYDRRKRQWVDTTGPYAGILRLAATHLTAEIIAHEATHAALHIARLHRWAQPGADYEITIGDMDTVEEPIAHMIGAITHCITRAINNAGMNVEAT